MNHSRTEMLKLITVILLALAMQASSKWVRARVGEDRCSLVCGRMALDTVISPKVKREVCAVRTNTNTFINAASRTGEGRAACRDQKGQASLDADRQDYCLCTEDGAFTGSDVRWIKSRDSGRCDQTCRSTGNKFNYAVYGTYIEQSWQHICASTADNTVGYVGGGQLGCKTDSGVFAEFKCLCSKSFAGDLEPGIDP